MGVGDSWGTEDELLHPRGPDGRFRESWKMASNVVSKILSTLSSFNPKTFASDEDAANYVHGQARSNRFLTNRGPAIDRFLRGYSTVNADLEAGKPNADAAAIKRGMSPLPDDLVLTRDMTFEQFGLNPQAPEGIRELTGKLVSSKMFSSTNIGTPLAHEPGKITMSIATPKGTKALIPSTSKPTKEIILDTDQPFRVTKVQPDGQGGWYVYAVATGDSNNEVPVDIGRAVPDNGVEAATPETPAAPAPAAPGAPAPVPAPGAPAAPIAAPVRTGRPGRPAGPPPAPRNEGHVGTVGTGQAPAAPGPGGVPGRAPEPAPSAPELPSAPEPGPDTRSTFRNAFEEAGLKVPSVGTRRKEFNDAYLGVASGKKTPQDAVRDLDDRIAIHKATIASDKEDGTDSGPLPEDVKRLQGLSDLIKEHYNFTGRKTPKAAPEKKAPAKKATLREEVSLNTTEKRLQKENAAAAGKVDNSDLDGKDAAQLRAIAAKEDIPTQGMGNDPEQIAQAIKDIRFKRTQPASGFGAPAAKKAATPLKAARKAAAPRPKLEERKDELSDKSADELRAIAAKEDIPTRNLGNNPEEIAQTIRDIRFKRDRNATPFKEAGKGESTPATRKAAQRKESRDRLAGGAEERARQTTEEKASREATNKAREDAATKQRDAEIADIAKQVDSGPPESELVKARIGISDSGFKSKRVSAADTAAGLRETAGQDYAKKDRDLLLKLADFYESKGRPRKAAPAKKAEPAAGDVDNMTVPQLRAEATRQGKKIPSSITKKADIQAFLKGDKEAPLSVAETKTIATGNNDNSVIGSRRTLDSLEAKGLIEFRDSDRPSGKPAPYLTEKGRKAAGFSEKAPEPKKAAPEPEKAPEPKKVTPPAKKAVPAEVVKDNDSHDAAITPAKAKPDPGFKPITDATGGDGAALHVPARAANTAFTWEGHKQPKWGLKQENDYGDGIDYYQKDGFIPVNAYLRGKREGTKQVAGAIRGIDGTMRVSKTTGPIETWRGSSSTKKLFGDKSSGSLVGMEWDEDAYVSTSTKEAVARNFAFNPNAKEGDEPLVMKVVTPKGVGALKMGSASHGTDEGEILLQRGMKMRVTKDLGVNNRGERVIEVQAIPQATTSPKAPFVAEAKYPNPMKLKGSSLQLDQAVRESWIKHRDPDSDWASIASIREDLDELGFTREEQDQAFMRIGRGSVAPHARVIPVADSQSLSKKERKNAFRMGGEDNHALMILDMDAEGKPKDLTTGKVSAPEKAPEAPEVPKAPDPEVTKVLDQAGVKYADLNPAEKKIVDERVPLMSRQRHDKAMQADMVRPAEADKAKQPHLWKIAESIHSLEGLQAKAEASKTPKTAEPATKAPETSAPDIDKMTIPQLREEAKRQGKRVPTGITKKADIQAFLKDDTENRKQSQAIREGVKATPADVKATAARSAAADAARVTPAPARKPEWGTLKTHGLKTGDEAMYYGSLRNSPKAQGRKVRIERAKYGGYDLIDVETDKKIADGANATRLWLSPLPRSPKTETPKPPAEKGLIYMTVPELREKARAEGIKVPPHRKTKAEIVDWLADSLAAKERDEPLPEEKGQREIRQANVAARKRLKAMAAEDRRKLAEAKAATPKKVLPTTGAPKSHEEIATNIRSAKTREEAEKVLNDANLTIPELRQLAESMDIATKGSKSQISKDIVYWGIGRKLDREAVSRPGAVTSRTLQDAMERRGDPSLVPVESRKPLLANHWGTGSGEIEYHEDGNIGRALRLMGPVAQRFEVPGENGDNLHNVLGRLATKANRGEITQQQLIDKVKAIHAKMPDSPATRALDIAIKDMEVPDLPPIELPNGTPGPVTKLARALEKIPVAHKDRVGSPGSNEVERLADLMAEWQQGRMTPLRFMAELRQRLLNNRHESEEGKSEIDDAVRAALQELEALMKTDRKKLLPPEMRK